MAAIIYVQGDLVETQFLGKFFGDPVKIVLSWRVKTTVFPSEAVAQLVQDVCTLFGSNCSNKMIWEGVRHRRLKPDGPTDYRENFFAPIPGGASGEVMPAQVAALWRINVETDAHPKRGRFYLPGVPTSHWANNAYTLLAWSVKNGLKGQLEQFLSVNGTDPRVHLVVVSRKYGPYDYGTMVTVTPTEYPAIQRSRKPPEF